MSIIKLPNLGDGITSATVLAILVKPGDTIQKDQTILELETDKATAPIPAPETGTVSKILVKEGATVSAGMAIIELEGGGASVSPQAPAQAAPSPQAAPQVPSQTPQAPVEQSPAPQPTYTYTSTSGFEPPASPSLRKTAHELGIDLGRVKGTAHGGRITTADVKAYIQFLQAKAFSDTGISAAPEAASQPQQKAASTLPDFSKWGDIERKPLSSLRKKIGQKMSESWTTVPHVTQFEEVDITDLMTLRKKHVPAFEKKEVKLTLTIFALKALIESLKTFPMFNSTFDEASGELIYKKYLNIGVAVDTENGLIVPVVKDVDKKSMLELCKDVTVLADKAKKRQIGLEDLQGGTFTLSNLGGLGVGPFTPIINTPEVAILALGAGKTKPVVMPDGKIQPRLLMPIGLSYDHRVIDGADGARFIKDLVGRFENFNSALLKS
jgi:pyruvate dehydrogenase E2 component (dihydrolipoamide acetyltransferase)